MYHNHDVKKDGFISEQSILDMITINAAKALSVENNIGSIEKSKKADLIFVKNAFYTNHIIENIIFNSELVETYGVMVSGKILMWDKKFIGVDEDKIIAEFKNTTEEIKSYLPNNF